jgi:hypothetical protein
MTKETRQGVRIDLVTDLKKYLEIQQEVSQYVYNPDYLMPPCLFIPRIVCYDLDNSAEDNNADLALTMYKRTSHHALYSTKSLIASLEDKSLLIKLNPLYTLLKVSEMPQKPKDLKGHIKAEGESSESEEDEMSDSQDEEKKEHVEKYIVNGLFGSEDNSSMLRVVLTTNSMTAICICDQVMAWRMSKVDDLSLFRETKQISEFLAESANKSETC